MNRNALADMLMPEGSGPQYNARAMPTQVARSYSPTWRDQLASMLMGDQRPSPERSRLVEGLTGSTGLSGGSGFGVADIVPGGQVLAAQEAGRKGDYSGMVMGMVGGPAGKVPGRGQLANALAPEQPKGITAYHGSPNESNMMSGPQYENSRIWYHGTRKDADIDTFSREFFGDSSGGLDGVWFTSNKSQADDYGRMADAKAKGRDFSPQTINKYQSQIIEAYEPKDIEIVDVRKMIQDSIDGGYVEPGASQYQALGDMSKWAKIEINRAKASGKKGVVFSGIDDDPLGGYGKNVMADHLVVFDPADVIRPASQPSSTVPSGFTAYHGSPHDFDRFDMSKIGTGEGAQAYGHGLYFAEAEDVAKSYRDDVSKWHSTMPRIGGALPSDDAMSAAASLVKSYGSIDEAIAARQGHIRDGLPPATERIYREDLANLQKLKDSGASVTTAPQQGRMYEVRINADPEDFLDWDKPLSQQSEKVRGLLDHPNVKRQTEFFGDPNGDKFTGRGAYGAVTGWNTSGGQRGIPDSSALRDAGIPGIRYLDQGSRGKPLEFSSRAEAEAAGYKFGGQDMPGGRYAPYDEKGLYISDQAGTRNYVLFRDDVIDIVKKYGVAFATTLYGADAVNQAMGPQPNARAGEE